MRRFLMLVAVAGLLVSAACGGDDDTGDSQDGEDSSPTSEPTMAGTPDPNAAPTQLPTRPSPTPAPDEGHVLTVYGQDGDRVKLTLARIRELATSTVEGFDEQGVALDALAAEVGFEGEASVTFRGYRGGSGNFKFAVGQYSELLPNTLIYITDEGQVAMKSGAIEEGQWLAVVDEVSFD